MATKYDAAVIMAFADSLYAQARSIIVTYAVAGLLVGAVVGGGIGGSVMRDAVGVFALVGAVIGLVGGISAGRARAFALKLQAQVALCQVQIEQNTSAHRLLIEARATQAA